MPPLTLEECLRRIVGADGDAAKQAFLAWADGAGIQRATARDAASRAVECVVLGQGPCGGFADARHLFCWLFRVASRDAIRAHVRTGRTIRLPAEEPVPGPLAQRQDAIRRALLDALANALARLPPEDRDLLTGCILDGRTQDDLGLRLGVSAWAVGRRYRRIVAELRETVLRLLDEEHAIARDELGL